MKYIQSFSAFENTHTHTYTTHHTHHTNTPKHPPPTHTHTDTHETQIKCVSLLVFVPSDDLDGEAEL